MSVNIPENVTLILKNSRWYSLPQAYIALDKKSIEAGLRLAEDKGNSSEMIEIKNGSIKAVDIAQASSGSSVGGKLSFWTCELTLPDDRKCSIGINSDNLCDFIKANTFINGKCKSNIYLGRENSSQAIFTENMESYKEGINKRKVKAKQKSTSYKPGDIVQTETSNQVYIGKIYKYLDIHARRTYGYGTSTLEYIITLHNNPKVVHWLPSLDIRTKIPDNHMYSSELYDNKPKRIITGDSISKEDITKAFTSSTHIYESLLSQPDNGCLTDLKTWLYCYMCSQKVLDTSEIDALEAEVRDRSAKYSQYMGTHWGSEAIKSISFYHYDDPVSESSINSFIKIS